MQTLNLEVKFATDEAGTFEGYASLFGGKADSQGDVIAPGAFRTSLAEHKSNGSRPALLWQHDPSEPIGTWEIVREDAKGLFVKGRLTIETGKGGDAYALLKSGALNGLSIGYRVDASTARPGGRLLTKLDLIEISLVTLPAASRARVTNVKSGVPLMEQDDIENEVDVLERVEALEGGVKDINEKLENVDDGMTALKKSAGRIEVKLNRPGAIETKSEKEEKKEAETKAFTSFIRRGDDKMSDVEKKDLSVGVDAEGGYLVPEDFRAELIKNLTEISPVRQAARIMRTGRDEVTLPTRTDTLTAAWVAEKSASSETQPVYGQKQIPVYESRCYVDATNKLLEDAAFNIGSELSMDFAEEFGRLESDAFFNGTGSGQPTGLLQASGVPETTAASYGAITYDELVDLFYALKAFYRRNGAWMMNASTIAEVRKLTDSQNRPLWTESIADGSPATILGRPVIEAPDMPSIDLTVSPTPSISPILFGDFNQAYRIVDRVDLSVLRDPFTQATNSMVRFHARRRVGADVVKTEAIRKLTMTP